MDGMRYAIVREPDGRHVVIDKQQDNAWVFGPAAYNTCNEAAKRLEREHRKEQGRA